MCLWFIRPPDSEPDVDSKKVQRAKEALFQNFEQMGQKILDLRDGDGRALLLKPHEVDGLKEANPDPKKVPGLHWLKKRTVVALPPFVKSNPIGELFAQYNWKIVAFLHNLVIQLMFANHHIDDREAFQWSCGGHPA